MSTEPPVQVLASSVDAPGLSAATSTRGYEESSQKGSAYNPASLAAGVPVWFHPMRDGRFRAVWRTRWTAATPGSAPQRYTAHTADNTSTWSTVEAATGISDPPAAIPSGQSSPGLVVAGASRSGFLWLLRDTGLLQWFRESPAGLALHYEERLHVGVHRLAPTTTSMTTVGADEWLGVEVDMTAVRVYYAVAGELYSMEKPWGRVGDTTADWLFAGADGPSRYAGSAAPLGVSSAGPVSVARLRGRRWLTTVEVSSGAYTGRAWSSRGPHDPWAASPLSVPLGGSPGWCGAGIRLQPHLQVNAAAVAALPANAAVPYAWSVAHTGSGESWVQTSWGLLVVDPQ